MTISQANMRLSAVDGTAFIDFSAANVLTDHIGKRLTVLDSAGKKLIGFIKAAGTGETYIERLINPGFEGTYVSGVAPNWGVSRGTKSEFTDSPHGGLAAQQIDNPAGNSAYLNSLGASAAGRLTKPSAWYKCLSGTGFLSVSDDVLNFEISTGLSQAAWTQVSVYVTAMGGAFSLNLYATSNAVAGVNSIVWDDASIPQVLTPSATGVTIVSTPGGTVFNWESKEAGFNYRDLAGYEYLITNQRAIFSNHYRQMRAA